MEQVFIKIKQYGIAKCLGRIVGDMIYSVAVPIYKLYIRKYGVVDNNQVLFYSTPSFSDNSKALYEYMLKETEFANYHFVWLVDRRDVIQQEKNNRTEFVNINTLYHKKATFKALKKIATSKFIFFTHASPVKYIEKRSEQLVVNLWHGCGYKDVEKTGVPWIQIDPFDVALVPGQVFIRTKTVFWGCSEEQVVPVGYPRYDLLISDNDNAKKFVQKLKGTSQKLIVWMPTFRKKGDDKYPEEKIEYSFDLPLLNSYLDVVALNDFCAKRKLTICLKRHPFQLRYSCEGEKFSNLKFISNDDLVADDVDLYAFLQYTDGLISDYSSVAIDYMLLDKPIAFSLDDYEKYKAARGFVFDDPLKYMPGHHLYNYEDMLEFIEAVANGADCYKEQRAEIMSQVHNPCDNYCERVWKTIEELAEKGN